jgi:hypothetical protein
MNDGEPTTERVYAWLAALPDGESDGVEAIISVQIGERNPMPLFATDLSTVEWMKPLAAQLCEKAGVKAYLVRFDRAQTLDIIETT